MTTIFFYPTLVTGTILSERNMDTNLATIDQIIDNARQAGATFGHGDPKTHLAYLTKLRLLPQTVRRKIGDRIIGCYPPSVVNQLLNIEGLKSQGLTYSQIKYQLATTNEVQVFNPIPSPLPHYSSPALSQSGNAVAFLIVGLFLGFLTATINSNHLATQTQASATTQATALPTTQPSLDSSSQNLVRLVTNGQTESADTVYIIALPQQNLDKLGKININYLNRN